MIHGSAIPLAFEAKETSKETNFPLFRRQKGRDIELVQQHQRDFLANWEKGGGMAFVLINFSNLNKCYRVPVDFIESYYINTHNGGRKSIPINDFKEEWIVNVDEYLAIT